MRIFGGVFRISSLEISSLFTFTNIFGKRGGAVCVIIANRVTDEFRVTDEMEKKAGLVASHAVTILAGWDEKKKKAGKRYLYPGLM